MMAATARATRVLKEDISANIQKQFLLHQNETIPQQQGTPKKNHGRRRSELGKEMIYPNGAVKDQQYTQPEYSRIPF